MSTYLPREKINFHKNFVTTIIIQNMVTTEMPGWLSQRSIKLLTSAQAVISGSWDQTVLSSTLDAQSAWDSLSLTLPHLYTLQTHKQTDK